MSITYNPHSLLYAIVEYLPDSTHLCDPVDDRPVKAGQYRLVCLAATSAEAWRLTHLLRALAGERFHYSVCPAEAESSDTYRPVASDITASNGPAQ